MSYNSELHVQMQDQLLQMAEQVYEGELSHLDALITMRQHKEQLEKSLDIIKHYETENLNEITNKADEYKGKYLGYEIKSVSGRKSYSFKGIIEVENAEQEKKRIEEKYKSAFDGFQKGTVLTEEVDGVLHWIDSDGFLQPFPELSIGKSYLTVSKAKTPLK